MPYTPQSAPAAVKRQLHGKDLRQWTDVWNSVYARCIATGRATRDCEGAAYAQAAAVAGLKAMANQ